MCQQIVKNLLAARTHARMCVSETGVRIEQKATRIQSEQMGKPSLREPIQEQFEDLNKSLLLHELS